MSLLSAMAQGGKDKPDQYMLEHYSVEEAFKHLNNSSALTLDQKAGLEFAYLEVLAQPRGSQPHYNIPNLERYVEVQPEIFAQARTWTYKREDGGTDPVEFQLPPERVATIAERGCKLLDAIKCIPGHNHLGELDPTRLARWIANVRQSCAELSRADVADICIGKVLSWAPIGTDRVWPCEPVRDAMEEIQSEPLMQGAQTGVYNSRGAHWRGEGGDQERDLVIWNRSSPLNRRALRALRGLIADAGARGRRHRFARPDQICQILASVKTLLQQRAADIYVPNFRFR